MGKSLEPTARVVHFEVHAQRPAGTVQFHEQLFKLAVIGVGWPAYRHDPEGDIFGLT